MDSILARLEDYGVSRQTGFVPDADSQRLPHPYAAWEALASALPEKLTRGVLLNDLGFLPPFSIEGLRDEHQWQRAYIVLAFLTHAVVHGHHETTVPAILAEPFLAVCSHLGVQPVLSYAGLCLLNWSRSGEQKLLDGLQCELSFTGTLDEAAFYLVPVIIELAGGHLPALLTQTLLAAAEGDWNTVTQHLELCSRTITCMSGHFDQLSLCNPQVFYNQIRPYIAGLDVAFERTNGVPLHIKHVGGSVVQSGFFMFLDHVLGVSHDSQILEDVKAYMPSGHRQFLTDIARQPSLLALMNTHDAPADARFKLAECRERMQKWRTRHIAIVTRYIVLPAQAAARVKGKEAVSVCGTAGSSPLPFLKQMRDDTIL